MLDIGGILREKRNELNKSLEEVHLATRVSVKHLKLLEENNFDFLPATYVKSYLKSYAASLGLDVSEILEQYEGRSKLAPEVQPESVVEPPGEVPEDALLETPPELETVKKPEVKKEIPAEPRPLVEWLLWAGLIILLSVTGFAYSRFTSRMQAETSDATTIKVAARKTTLADITAHELQADSAAGNLSPIELQIRARTNLAIEVSVDGQSALHHNLSPNEQSVWLARDRFEVTLSQISNPLDFKPAGAQDSGIVTFSLSREDIGPSKDTN